MDTKAGTTALSAPPNPDLSSEHGEKNDSDFETLGHNIQEGMRRSEAIHDQSMKKHAQTAKQVRLLKEFVRQIKHTPSSNSDMNEAKEQLRNLEAVMTGKLKEMQESLQSNKEDAEDILRVLSDPQIPRMSHDQGTTEKLQGASRAMHDIHRKAKEQCGRHDIFLESSYLFRSGTDKFLTAAESIISGLIRRKWRYCHIRNQVPGSSDSPCDIVKQTGVRIRSKPDYLFEFDQVFDMETSDSMDFDTIISRHARSVFDQDTCIFYDHAGEVSNSHQGVAIIGRPFVQKVLLAAEELKGQLESMSFFFVDDSDNIRDALSDVQTTLTLQTLRAVPVEADESAHTILSKAQDTVGKALQSESTPAKTQCGIVLRIANSTSQQTTSLLMIELAPSRVAGGSQTARDLSVLTKAWDHERRELHTEQLCREYESSKVRFAFLVQGKPLLTLLISAPPNPVTCALQVGE